MAKALTARIIKATSMLGSTQVLNMLCSVVRMKLLTLWVGELGVGLMGVLTQASDMVGNLSQLGMRTTAVRDLSAADTPSRRSAILTCVRRYSLLLGLLGMAIMLLLAPVLSRATFGNYGFTWAYALVSLSPLLVSLQGGQHVVLQSAGRYKAIAASGLLTALFGLLIAAPLFFFLRQYGVPIAIVGYGVAAFLAPWYFARSHRPLGPPPTWRDSLRLGRGFIATGAILTLTSLMTDGVNFTFLAFMGHHGDEALGHFQAGYTMLWRYCGVFFTVFGVEFYPRISRLGNRRRAVSLMLTHQGITFTLMLIPFVALAMALAPWLIRLLYRESFMPLLPYFVWGLVGMVCRPLSVSVSFAFLAASKGKAYAASEVISAVIGLACNIIGFRLGGFAGLGLATIIWLYADLIIILTAARISDTPLPRPRAILTALLAPLPLLPLAALLS